MKTKTELTEFVLDYCKSLSIRPPTDPGLAQFIAGELRGYANVLEDEAVQALVVKTIDEMRRAA